MTLNTFHLAGVAEMSVTTGLPRIIEIFDGRKELKTPTMEIYLKPPYSEGKDIKKIALIIKESVVEEITKELSINVADNNVEVVINIKKMEDIGLDMQSVQKAIEKGCKTTAKVNENMIIVKNPEKDEGLRELYKLKEKIRKCYVQGVKNIMQVLPIKRGNEFVIVTAGTNMKKVFDLDFVDPARTKSNDIYEIFSVLGIEAARQTIIDETFKVIESQGLNIDVRHVMLVADMMCNGGVIKGITRYGIVSEKSSVLARASFETPIKHLINAALVGEEDLLASVVENVMINQPVPVGTGLPGLIVKSKK